MNDDIKNKVKLKHKLYHRYLRHKMNNEDFTKLEDIRNEIDNLISKSTEGILLKYQQKTKWYANKQ